MLVHLGCLLDCAVPCGLLICFAAGSQVSHEVGCVALLVRLVVIQPCCQAAAPHSP